jgi:hypothetical protein
VVDNVGEFLVIDDDDESLCFLIEADRVVKSKGERDDVAVGLFQECVSEMLFDADRVGLTDPDTLGVSDTDGVLLLKELVGE